MSNITDYLYSMLLSLPAIIVAFSFHEWGHAYAAYRLGDPTAKNLGRMTVNPIAHIDPIGFLLLLIVGFGWAKPVPVNPRNFSNYKRDDIIVSLAGVTMNLIIAIVFAFIFVLMIKLQVTNEVLYTIISAFITINIGLMLFNIIPVPPLDGSHVFLSLFASKLSSKFLMFYQQYRYYLMLVVVIVLNRTGILEIAIGGIANLLVQLFGNILGIYA